MPTLTEVIHAIDPCAGTGHTPNGPHDDGCIECMTCDAHLVWVGPRRGDYAAIPPADDTARQLREAAFRDASAARYAAAHARRTALVAS